MARKEKVDQAPKGGWLGPPSANKLPAIAVVNGQKKGQWLWKKCKLNPKQLKKQAKFQKAMKKADAKDQWRI